MHNGEAILLLLLCVGAYIAPAVSRRIMIPPAVGEIIFGIMIAPFFHTMHEQQIVGFLAELGFLVLMYLAGLEIDFDIIAKMRKKELSAYFVSILLIVLFSVLVVALSGGKPIMAVAYMTVAIGLLFPVLHDLDLLDRPEGQSLLVLGGIGEIFSLAGLTVVSLYYQYGVSVQAAVHFAGLIGFVAAVFVFTKGFRLFVWWFPKVSNVLTTTGTASEMGIRANFVNMFIFVTGAVMIGVEAIIGAFIGGMIFSLLFRSKIEIQEIFSGVGNGFLIPIFFINVGLNFKLGYLADMSILADAAVFSVVMLGIRYASMVHFLFTGVPFRLFVLAPVSLSFPLTLLVTVAMFGTSYGILTERESAVLVVTALVTAVVYPVIAKTLAKRFIPPTSVG